tara:strand:- start:17615 stop:18139 length:525 start_codon:yes stop_codon:yes gene_type:complete
LKKAPHIILENALDSNMKLYVYIISLFALCFPIVMIFNTEGLFIWIGVLLGIMVIGIAISIWTIKKGFIKTNKGTRICYFSWGVPIFMEAYGAPNKPVLSILKFKKRGRAAFVSVANPEFSEKFNAFCIYLLNEKHTQKKVVLCFKKEKNARLAIDFLLKHTSYREEIYSPDFS